MNAAAEFGLLAWLVRGIAVLGGDGQVFERTGGGIWREDQTLT